MRQIGKAKHLLKFSPYNTPTPSDLESPVSKGSPSPRSDSDEQDAQDSDHGSLVMPPDLLDSPTDASVDAVDAGFITSEPDTRPINGPPTPAPATPEPAEQADSIDEDDFMAELEDLLGG
jgi:hypothetical protein